jgi:ribose transport system substrate-binding protein
MLAGRSKAGRRLRPQGRALRPTSETDINQQVQLIENSISRGADAIVLASNSSNALNSAIKRAAPGRHQGDHRRHAVTTPTEGFIGTDNVKAGEQAGSACATSPSRPARPRATSSSSPSVAGIQTLKDRDGGFRAGLRRARAARRDAALQQQRPQHRGQPGQRRPDGQPGPRSASSPTTTPRAPGAARASRTTGPPTASRSSPSTPIRRRTRPLTDGSIDALVVQNPYFFGYQGVVQAGMAAVGSQPPLNLDPGAVVADKANMASPTVKAAAEPPDREGAVVMGATVNAQARAGTARQAPGGVAARRRQVLRARSRRCTASRSSSAPARSCASPARTGPARAR